MVIAGLIAAALFANVLFTPALGSVLVLVSARTPDHVEAVTIDLHSVTGDWKTLGQAPAQSVPVAPAAATVIQSSAAIGDYDSIRIAGATIPIRVQVRQQILATVLIAISDGRPVQGGVYVGSEGVSLGLNELSGHLRAMPIFKLVDQFGRPFTNATIAGHVVILGAFHTTARPAPS